MDDWISLGDVLRRLPGASRPSALTKLFDVVKASGIYFLDLDFDRRVPCAKGSPECAGVLKLIRRTASFERSEASALGGERMHPQESTAGDEDDPFECFGWPASALPPGIPTMAAETVPTPGEDLALGDVLLHVCALRALLAQLGIEPDDVHAGRKINRILLKGVGELDRGTIRKFLLEVRRLQDPQWVSSMRSSPINRRRQVTALRVIGGLAERAKGLPMEDRTEAHIASVVVRLGLSVQAETIRVLLGNAALGIQR